MRNVRSVDDLQTQRPCVLVTELGKRRHMFTYERFLVSLHRTLGTEDMELYATKAEIAVRLGVCATTITRAVMQLKRTGCVSSRPITDQNCATIGNSYRLTDKGVRVAQEIEESAAKAKGADDGH